MDQHFDVAIVGYGPVGAALANLLDRFGLRVVVLEQSVSPYSLPRATHLDGEAMRILQSAGVGDAIKPDLGVYSRMRFEDASGAMLLDWPRPTTPGLHGWRDSNRFHQPHLEKALRVRVETLPLLDVRLGWRVAEIRQDAHKVDLSVVAPGETVTRSIEADFVVGCDGARSTVRDAIGSQLISLAQPEQWLVADFVLKPSAPSLPEGTVQYCDPARPFTYIEAVGQRRRWEVKLMPGDDGANFASPENVWRLLQRWIAPSDAEIERAVVYTFRSAVAARWREGRILIAGDAAHQTPPFLGQGLCAGLRDVANLSWKLAWVLDERANLSLLDTYQSELAPHVTAFINEANRIGEIIQETDPIKAQARDAKLRAQPQILAAVRPRLGPGLQGDSEAPAGALAPQPRLRDGRLMDDVAGGEFALLAKDDIVEAATSATRDALARARVRIFTDEALGWLDEIGAQAALIRPDHYVLGVAHRPDELDAITRKLPLRLRA